MATKKPLSGGARLTASGKRPVLLGLSPEAHDMLREAAEIDHRPLTQFLEYHAIQAAKKILKKSS